MVLHSKLKGMLMAHSETIGRDVKIPLHVLQWLL